MEFIQRRAFERVPVNIRARFYSYNTDFSGTITNLSENGMFISMKKMMFPLDSKIEIIIPHEKKLLKVPVRVIRMTKSGNVFNGLGVELLVIHREYLEFINSLKCEANVSC
ncbi:MAG: PilZ domain-containing protein [Nitrospiraceae bacterium]|nr:MAG: PilZ domain-containing protein [Nitrospiraceae bacterium]